MTDYDVTTDELETLGKFQSDHIPADVDPMHLAKLLSLALIVQREGGPEITASGRELLDIGSTSRSVHVEGAGRPPGH